MCILHILFRTQRRVKNYVYNAHMTKDIREIHDALLDIIACMSRPEPDVALLAGLDEPLDRALMPLLVRIERRGPIGVVELADVVGRDHTTVSRQVARLDELGLVTRRPGKKDKRVREAEATPLGRQVADAIDQTRVRLMSEMLADWSVADRHELVRLMKRFAGDMNDWVARRKSEDGAEEGAG